MKNARPHLLHSAILVAIGLAGMCGRTRAAQPPTATWNGGGRDVLWTNAANWGGTAPAAGSILHFSGNAGLAAKNDFPADTQFDGIAFNSTAGAFGVVGNGINLAGGIADNSTTNAESLNLGLALTTSETVSAVGGGQLTLGGAITDVSTGGTSPTGSTNSSLTIDGPGTVTLSGSGSSIGGTLTVDNGTVVVAHGAAFATSGGYSYVGHTTGPAKLDVQGGTLTFGGHSHTGGGSGFVIGGSTNTPNHPTSAVVTQEGGIVNVNGGFFGGETATTSSYTISGGTLRVLILNGGDHSSFTLHVKGTGTVNLTTTHNNFLTNKGNGTLIVDSGTFSSAPNYNFFVTQGSGRGVIELNGGVLSAGRIDAAVGSTGTSTFDFNGGTLLATNMGANSGSGGAGLTTVNVQDGGAIIDIHGDTITISDNLRSDPSVAGGTDGGLTLNDSSTHHNGELILCGTGNTYNGNTTVKAGTLQIDSSFLAKTSTVAIAGGAAMKLHYLGTNHIARLVLGGVRMPPGTYGYGHRESAFFPSAGRRNGTLTVGRPRHP